MPVLDCDPSSQYAVTSCGNVRKIRLPLTNFGSLPLGYATLLERCPIAWGPGPHPVGGVKSDVAFKLITERDSGPDKAGGGVTVKRRCAAAFCE